MVGQTLGHYKILDKLGAGGMGEVYRAQDTTLDREVALKILPPGFAEKPDRLNRFRREAKMLAALDHPNIVTVYSMESSTEEGVAEVSPPGTRVLHHLTMQLLEGQTLADRIGAGPIPLTETLGLFRQIAAALRAAHHKGIIHRDLKPANIRVTPEGQVKLLDFGLAKAGFEAPATVDLSQSPTLDIQGTEVGMLIGTAPYMSPEQARG